MLTYMAVVFLHLFSAQPLEVLFCRQHDITASRPADAHIKQYSVSMCLFFLPGLWGQGFPDPLCLSHQATLGF